MPHLTRRQLLHSAGAAAATLALAPLSVFARQEKQAGQFTVPPLPYPYEALEPHIDKQTMQIHHDKHHAAYVKGLNAALAGQADLAGKSVEELLSNHQALPAKIKQAVINSGGGHINHTMFWQIMAPPDKGGGGEPEGGLAQAINTAFGDFSKFKTTFGSAALKQFGSGWAWLVLTKEGKLEVHGTPNQNNPLLAGNKPLMGIDVWEHAYYLKYQNRRGDYIKAWWNVVNWKEISNRYAKAKA